MLENSESMELLLQVAQFLPVNNLQQFNANNMTCFLILSNRRNYREKNLGAVSEIFKSTQVAALQSSRRGFFTDDQCQGRRCGGKENWAHLAGRTLFPSSGRALRVLLSRWRESKSSLGLAHPLFPILVLSAGTINRSCR